MSAFTDAFEHYTEGMQVAPGASRGCPDCMLEEDVAVTCSSCGHSESYDMSELMTGGETLIVCCTDFKLDAEKRMTDEEYYALANEANFSSTQCDGCGSNMGGDRHPAHTLLEKEWIHIEVCTDCLMYIANGDEPVEGEWR